MSHDLPVQFAL